MSLKVRACFCCLAVDVTTAQSDSGLVGAYLSLREKELCPAFQKARQDAQERRVAAAGAEDGDATSFGNITVNSIIITIIIIIIINNVTSESSQASERPRISLFRAWRGVVLPRVVGCSLSL